MESLVKKDGFKKLQDIEPKEIKKENLIKTKYTEQLMQFIDESQITKEICEDLDPFALEYRIDKASDRHEETGKFVKSMLKTADKKLTSNHFDSRRIRTAVQMGIHERWLFSKNGEFDNFTFSYAGVKGVSRCLAKIQE